MLSSWKQFQEENGIHGSEYTISCDISPKNLKSKTTARWADQGMWNSKPQACAWKSTCLTGWPEWVIVIPIPLFFPCFTSSTIPIFHFFHWIHAAQVQPDISTEGNRDSTRRFAPFPGPASQAQITSPSGRCFQMPSSQPLSTEKLTMAWPPSSSLTSFRSGETLHSHVFDLHKSVYKRHTIFRRCLLIDPTDPNVKPN